MQKLKSRVEALEQSSHDDIIFTVSLGAGDNKVQNVATGEEFYCGETEDWRVFLSRIGRMWGIDLNHLYWNTKPEDVKVVDVY